MAFQPQERAKAKAEGKVRYFTGRPCKHGHVAERMVVNGHCVECLSIKQANKRVENPEATKQRDAAYYKKYRDKNLTYAAKYRTKNAEKVAKSCKAWRQKNKGKRAAMQMKRQAQKIQATPQWLSSSQKGHIEIFYLEAARLSQEFHVPIHVDHIIPLRGENVCGLHVPWNMQLVTQSYNCSKNNKMVEAPTVVPQLGNVLVHSSALPWKLKEA
jgi:hypothetical protein